MMTAHRRRWVVALLALLLCGSVQSTFSSRSLRPGQAFPDLKLVSFDGRVTGINSFRGRTVILNIWATWCAPCRREMSSLQRLSETLDRDRAIMIGVSADSDLFRAREYVRSNAFSFARFIDPNLRLAREVFDIDTLPSTFVIAPDGRLVEQVIGARDWLQPPASLAGLGQITQ